MALTRKNTISPDLIDAVAFALVWRSDLQVRPVRAADDLRAFRLPEIRERLFGRLDQPLLARLGVGVVGSVYPADQDAQEHLRDEQRLYALPI
jgi:hypothetical protein